MARVTNDGTALAVCAEPSCSRPMWRAYVHVMYRLCALGEDFAADQHAADFRGAGADLVELGVAQQAPGGVIVDVAVAAQDLHRVQCHAGGGLGGVEDRAGGVLPGRLAAIAGPRDGIDVGPAGAEAGIYVGDLALDQLEFADRLAELFAVVDVGDDRVEAGLHDADRPGRQYRALVIEAAHQDAHALALLAEQVFRRHFAILEHQFRGRAAAHAQFVELLRRAKPGETLLDQEGGDAARARLGPGLGVDH